MWYHRGSDYAVVAVTTCLSDKIEMDVSRFACVNQLSTTVC